MAEIRTIFLGGKGVVAVFVGLTQKVQKSSHVRFVHKIPHVNTVGHWLEVFLHIARPSTEKFTKVECAVLDIDVTANEFIQVVGENFQFGQIGIGIGIAKILLKPIFLFTLFHNVVPSENFRFFEFVQQIEGRARQAQNFGIIAHFVYGFDDGLSEFGQGAFVSLVYYDKVPLRVKNVLVFVELSANRIRPPQILHGRKVHKLFVAVDKVFDFFTVCFRTENVIGVVKYLAEILEPPIPDNRAMCQNQCVLKFTFLCHLQGSESFSETHFGVPKHLVSRFELFDCSFDGVGLFGAKNNGAFALGYFGRQQRGTPFLYGGNSLFCRFQIYPEPLVCFVFRIEKMTFYSRTNQNLMYIMVSERLNKRFAVLDYPSHGKFGVQQFVFDTCCLGVFVDTVFCGDIQPITIGQQLCGLFLRKASCLTYFE